ncbi:amidohydrolase family protein [Erythrobacter sp. F6033]|uniref:amidohydrolase family protein n=1 Tax=Erythrobacter sp. F6033 TaxID=2926401 RepID=UPI001FF24313|nr:amidohydrolase family protein [Erythrobacter sp. F6033]MCK0128509.1 amidohydrolase family protein [Erythrobacter sp. F6033]
MTEAIIEPDLPIIDPHHHLWDLRPMLPMFPEPRHRFIEGLVPVAHYAFDQFNAEVACGHNILATIFMECGAFYNAGYGEAKKTVGEVEFVNGVAAQSASGLYGNARLCTGIVGHADLLQGSSAGEVLDALLAASPNRFKGIRHQGAWDADPEVLGPPFHAPPELYRDAKFREGFAELSKRGMSFDAWILEPQLPDVIDLARAFPDTPICLDHCGTPLGMASYAGKLEERFDVWRTNILELGKCENVMVKLGGLAMHNCAMPEQGPAAGIGSEELARLWKPYIETCIEAFGTKRAMFESNYPVDRWGATYPVLWNAFKRIASGASAEEKAALFAGNAARFYRVEHVLA